MSHPKITMRGRLSDFQRKKILTPRSNPMTHQIGREETSSRNQIDFQDYKNRQLTSEQKKRVDKEREDFKRIFRSGIMERIGLDIGTKNIILAYEKDGKKKIRQEINGFLKVPRSDGFVKQMLVGSGVPYVEKEDNFIILGTKAEELSYAFNKTLQRPMQDGVISGKEDEAMEVMAIIIHSIIGKLNDDAIMYYCIPADALNADTNIEFHDKVMEIIISQFSSECTVKPYPINEARALVIGQIEDKTGIGISFGAGMVNVCYCLYGIEIFKFSLVGSGDRIDVESAKRFGYDPKNPSGDYRETPTSICKRKENRLKDKPFTLTECPTDSVGKSIWINYGILIESVVKGIIEGFRDNEEKARIDRELPVVIAGGTSSPDGFIEYFKDVWAKMKVPFEIGDISRCEKPLYAVAEGCLIAAQLHEDDQ